MRAAAVLLIASCASAQMLVDTQRLPKAFQSFDVQPGEVRMGCSFQQIKPSLSLSFRYQAGWSVTIPAKEFGGARHRSSIMARVTPEGGEPVYLGSNLRVPPLAPAALKNTKFNVVGSFQAGEGKYEVAIKVVDDRNHVCTAHWTTEAKRAHNERDVKIAMAPGTVTDLSRWNRATAKDDSTPFRLTVFLHAAPFVARRFPRMSPRDRVQLAGLLSALLEHVPTKSVRLVVFNLDQQKELLRLDDFQPGAMGQVVQAMNELELGKVDFEVLKNRKGHVDLVADLINRELAEPQPADAVVFLGPPARFEDKVPVDAVEKPSDGLQRFFYVQYRMPFQRMVFSDSIQSAVSRMKGRMLVVQKPADLARAISEIERRAAASVATADRQAK